MRILLLAATRSELVPTLHWLKEHENQVAGHLIISGITGVGSMLSAWWMGRHLAEIRPQLVIQAGIAGSFEPRDAGQPLAVNCDCLADLGVWEQDEFRSIFDLKLLQADQPPFEQACLINPHRRLIEASGLPEVKAVTINQISTDEKEILRYKNSGAALESMEGAALHYSCLQAGIPFLQIRTVSNLVGVRDKKEWQLEKAVESLNLYLQNWLPTIKSEWL